MNIIYVSLLLFVFFSDISGCIKKEYSDENNIECIKLIEKTSDIKPEVIAECSSLTQEENWIGYLCLCRINTIRKNISVAQKACFKAKEKKPFSPDVYTELANLYSSMGKVDEAIIEADFAFKISTTNFYANMILAMLYEKTNPQKAYIHYKNAYELTLKSSSPYLIGKKTFFENKLKRLNEEAKKRAIEKKEREFSKCIERYRREKNNSEKALEIIEECLAIKETNDPSILIDYMESLYQNYIYQKVVDTSLKVNEKNLNPSMKEKYYFLLASSYKKLNNSKKALNYYSRLYKMKNNDIGMLKDYAELCEKENDKLTALEVYKKIYNIKPDGLILKKIEDLKFETMSWEEILNELKLRGFIEKEKVVLSPEDRKLYRTIKLVESKGAIEWLKQTYYGYANLYIEDEKTKELKLMPDGYNLYLRYISQKAVKRFMNEKVNPYKLFSVVDENGDPIFDKKGRLTYEGLVSFYDAENTDKKIWYYPDEKPKKYELNTSYNSSSESHKDKKKLDKEIEELKEDGYDEISETEYNWLKAKTKCPDNVLLSYPCNIKKIKYGEYFRYFACSKIICCGGDPYATAIKLYSYIIDYRQGKKEIDDTLTNFFGSGPKKYSFCENGKIWKGPELIGDGDVDKRIKEDIEKIEEYRKKMKQAIKQIPQRSK